MMHAAIDQRRTTQPVRRDSFDVNDKRAQVFRPIDGGIAFVDAYLKVLEEWADMVKQKGEAHRLTANCHRVLAAILKRCTDFKTGICEPSLDTIMKHTRFARATVVSALKRLWSAGFIDWIRRTVPTDNAGGEGPQIRQTSNAYFFDLSRLPERCMKRLKEIMRRKGKDFEPDQGRRRPLFKGIAERRASNVRQRRENLAVALQGAKGPMETAVLLYPGNPIAQASYLAMFAGDEAQSASSAPSLNPPSSIKYQKE
jgi:predicted transcriptional regulator